MREALDFLLHVDDHVKQLIRDHGAWAYGILFGIIFGETGFVVLPFLPGDSLLFATGIFCHPDPKGYLNVWVVIGSLSLAAFLGDNVNYQIGRVLGTKLFQKEDSRFFKKSYITLTHSYFERYGGWTLVVARFVPIVRTFAPFVAGMGTMPFHRFLAFSAFGGFFWVSICTLGGYFFGQIPAVQDHFELIMLGIIAVSVVPAYFKIRSAKKHLRQIRAEANGE